MYMHYTKFQQALNFSFKRKWLCHVHNSIYFTEVLYTHISPLTLCNITQQSRDINTSLKETFSKNRFINSKPNVHAGVIMNFPPRNKALEVNLSSISPSFIIPAFIRQKRTSDFMILVMQS